MARDTCDLLCLNLEVAEDIRLRRLDLGDAERMAGEAKALGDATRLTLVAALGEAEELCVCDLAWVLERPENLVSHHLRVLRSTGLATSRREGKMVMYSLSERGRELAGTVLSRAIRT